MLKGESKKCKLPLASFRKTHCSKFHYANVFLTTALLFSILICSVPECRFILLLAKTVTALSFLFILFSQSHLILFDMHHNLKSVS